MGERYRRWRRMASAAIISTAGLGGLAGCAIEPADPGTFYSITPGNVAAKPGEVLRIEPFPGAPAGASAYRVLYSSTGLDGKPIPVSGVVVVPPDPAPAEGRPVVAWAHPTTGVANRCAPSETAKVFERIQGLEAMIGRGYVVAATDYPGLGTQGTHPYLVGVSEGRAVLDSVRAAAGMKEAGASRRFAAWGHSQGGQAALYAGELAAGYAPDLQIAGIAAAAPATDLATLLRDDLGSAGGKVLASFAMWSWNRVYDAPLDPILAPEAKPVVDGIARDCIETDMQTLVIADMEQFIAKRFLIADVTEVEPWKSLLAQNTPGKAPAGGPVFLAQGTGDKTVRPQVTYEYARALCAKGTPVVFDWMKGVNHDKAGKEAAPTAVDWMAGVIEGRAPPDQCRNLPRMPG